MLGLPIPGVTLALTGGYTGHIPGLRMLSGISQSHSSMSKYTLAPENVSPADRVCTDRSRLAQSISSVSVAFDATTAEFIGWHLHLAVKQNRSAQALIRDSVRKLDAINLALAFEEFDMLIEGNLSDVLGTLGHGLNEDAFPSVVVIHTEGLHDIWVDGHCGLVLAKRGPVHVLTGKFERTPLLLPAGVGGLL